MIWLKIAGTIPIGQQIISNANRCKVIKKGQIFLRQVRKVITRCSNKLLLEVTKFIASPKRSCGA